MAPEIACRPARLHEQVEEHQRRHDEAQDRRHRAGDHREHRSCSRQPIPRRASIAAAGLMEARFAAREALEEKRHRDDRNQDGRELRGGSRVGKGKPGAVDAGGEHGHAEIGDGAVIGEGLHRGKRRARDERGPGQGQRHGEERLPRPAAEQQRRLARARRFAQEPRPHQEIHIRIKRQRQHQRRSGERADVGKEVIARFPSSRRAKGALHRPEGGEEIGVGIGEHIGGRGQGQHQSRLEHAPAGGLAARDQPCRRHADDEHADDHEQAQAQRVQDVLAQHRLGQMHEDGAWACQYARNDRGERHRERQREDERRCIERGKPPRRAGPMKR